MNSASPLCHEALLTLARKLEGAASDRARDLATGQQRIVDHLVPLAVDVQNADLSGCDGLARQLVAELSLQADYERRSGLAGAIR